MSGGHGTGRGDRDGSDSETWEPRPLPEVTPETAPFWAAAAAGRFLVCECEACGLVYYYPRAVCPDCFSDDVTWLEAAGTGRIYSFSWTERVEGWPEAALPLVVAYVELDEGPRVMTNVVDADPEALDVGTRVEVEFVPTEADGVAVPVFAPTEE